MKIKITEDQWKEIGAKTGWNAPIKKEASKFSEIQMKQMFDAEISKGKTPEEAAEMVINEVSDGALDSLRGERKARWIETIVRKFSK